MIANARRAFELKDMDLTLMRLYIVYRVADEPIGRREILQKLHSHGFAIPEALLSNLLRGLERGGYLVSTNVHNGCHQKTYQATERGRSALQPLIESLRSLFAVHSLSIAGIRRAAPNRPHAID